MKRRVEFDAKSNLDEVVSDGGGHLERLGRTSWFVNLVNADGSSVAVWIEGKVVMHELRAPPAPPPRCGGDGMTWRSIKDDPPPKDGTWFMAVPAGGWVRPRIVRFYDAHDRFPMHEDMRPWPIPPTHWMPLPEPPA